MNDAPSTLLVVCAGLRVNVGCSQAIDHLLANQNRRTCYFLLREWLSDDQFRRAILLWIVDNSVPWDAVHFALVNGIPILASDDNTSIRELCLLANCGLFYRSAPEAALCLQLIVESQSLRDHLGANARAYITRHQN